MPSIETDAPPPPKSFRGILTGAPGTMIVRVAGRGLSLGSTIIVTRLLGVSDYGVYTFALAWATLLTLPTTIGFDRLLVRFVAKYEAHENRAMLAGLVRFSDIVILGLSLIVMALVAIAAATLATPTYATALLLTIPLIPVQSLMQVAQFIVQGLHHPEQSQIPAIIVIPILFIAILLGLHLSGLDIDYSAALLANLAATLAAFGVATLLRRRHLHPMIKNVVTRSYEKLEWRHALAPLAIVGMISNGNSQIGLLMLGWLSTSTQVGSFAAANKVAQVVFLANMAINAALAPRIARFHALGQTEAIRPAAMRASRYNLAFALPIGIVLIALQGPLLGVFGSGFGAGGAPMTILVGAQICNAFTGSVGVVLLMTGHSRQVAWGMGIALALDALLCLTLIPPFGATGAAIAAAADMVTWNAALAFIAWKTLRVNATALAHLPWRSQSPR